jgi:hypothetical protein
MVEQERGSRRALTRQQQDVLIECSNRAEGFTRRTIAEAMEQKLNSTAENTKPLSSTGVGNIIDTLTRRQLADRGVVAPQPWYGYRVQFFLLTPEGWGYAQHLIAQRRKEDGGNEDVAD